MGTRENGVDQRTPEELEQEIARIREDIEPLARELDRRRHSMMDWRTQVRRRAPKAVRLLGLAVGVVTAVKVARKRLAHRHATA